jgi:AraC-like DNA-binding protein
MKPDPSAIIAEALDRPFKYRTTADVMEAFDLPRSMAGRFSAKHGLAKKMRKARKDAIIHFVIEVNPTLSMAAYARHFGVSESYINKLFNERGMRRW